MKSPTELKTPKNPQNISFFKKMQKINLEIHKEVMKILVTKEKEIQ